MSRSTKELNAMEADRDVLLDIIDDYADRWDIEEAIGTLKHAIHGLNNKRAVPERVVKIYK